MAGTLASKAALTLLGLGYLAAGPAFAQQDSGSTPPGSAPPVSEQVDTSPFLSPGGQLPDGTGSDQGGERPVADPAPEARVLIAEVVVEGLDGHPEAERLEIAAYESMRTIPGSRVSRPELEADLAAIYATGWFADVRIQPVDGPLGVSLVVTVVPNPVLSRVTVQPAGEIALSEEVIAETFASDFGRTLNLNTLQTRMQALQAWYTDQGFSLARVTGPSRVSPGGVVELLVREGTVDGVEVQFINSEGEPTDEQGQPIRGKTQPWVVTREVSLEPGSVFNRRQLEDDIRRLYGTGLFSDVRVTLRPVAGQPGNVVVVLGIVEQSTGSLSGGVGFSQSQGVFGQISLQESNLLGRAWDLGTNFSYGQFGGLGDLTFFDPWIKGDKHRTSFRARAFFSREIPQIFQSRNSTFRSGSQRIKGADFEVVTNDPLDIGGGDQLVRTNFDNVAIQRVGASVQFVRPLNGGDPFAKSPWNLILAFGGQEVTPMNFAGSKYSQAVVGATKSPDVVSSRQVICIAYNCASENQLLSFRIGTTYNSLDDSRNPTRGNFLSLSTEQFLSVGNDSPTFNRIRGSISHFIPVNWLKIYKGCRPGPGEPEDCSQALGFQLSGGTLIGNEIPPYEAFCLGGGNSVRGYFDCDLGVGKSFAEFTVEYRFPLFSIVSGSVFFDAGTTFGTQSDIPGNPGGLLGKNGEGFSPGIGLIVTTPVGPLRLEVASEDFTDEWRFNLGVGWKF
ncbi:MAG: BamA/OMP85 family outer membrane protein [Prochlorococcaceae cyanobacterium]